MKRRVRTDRQTIPGGDYKVGYGRPPTETRFKPGQSGNPKGRRKGTKNLKTDLVEELTQRILVTENGRQVRHTKQRLLVKALLAQALKGETRASSLLINLLSQTLGLDPPQERVQELAPDDQEILDEFRKHAADRKAR
jgi:hypothetical protein